MTEVIEHELGVWINQRHEDYLKDPGLGYGAVRDLYLSATEWWDGSIYNPLRDETEDAERRKTFARGTALHTHVLDGPKVYDRIYGIEPTAKGLPDYIYLVRDLQDACARYGLSTHGLQGELVARLIQAKAPVPLLADAQERFRRSGRLPVSERDDIRIKMLYRMMQRSPQELRLPDGDHLTLRDALHKALTEISVFWIDENDIRQRARFDLLKPNFTGDLKSITQWKKSDFHKSLLSEVIFRGYMIQAAHYHEARRQLRIAVAEGRVFGGNKGQRKLLERVAKAGAWAWVFIFAKMDGASQVKGIVIRPESGQFIKAQQQREEALANFLWHREFHGGLDIPWFDPEVVWEPEETDWPEFSVLGQ